MPKVTLNKKDYTLSPAGMWVRNDDNKITIPRFVVKGTKFERIKDADGLTTTITTEYWCLIGKDSSCNGDEVCLKDFVCTDGNCCNETIDDSGLCEECKKNYRCNEGDCLCMGCVINRYGKGTN